LTQTKRGLFQPFRDLFGPSGSQTTGFRLILDRGAVEAVKKIRRWEMAIAARQCPAKQAHRHYGGSGLRFRWTGAFAWVRDLVAVDRIPALCGLNGRHGVSVAMPSTLK
jgi:hypothetical protein